MRVVFLSVTICFSRGASLGVLVALKLRQSQESYLLWVMVVCVGMLSYLSGAS